MSVVLAQPSVNKSAVTATGPTPVAVAAGTQPAWMTIGSVLVRILAPVSQQGECVPSESEASERFMCCNEHIQNWKLPYKGVVLASVQR